VQYGGPRESSLGVGEVPNKTTSVRTAGYQYRCSALPLEYVFGIMTGLCNGMVVSWPFRSVADGWMDG
jgi:hypothetical protein